MRIRERDLAITALKMAALSPNGLITTSNLITALEQYFAPEGEDAEILHGRNDNKFSQKVRNLVSHRDGSSTMFSKGYANYLERESGIQITDKGRYFLSQVPE